MIKKIIYLFFFLVPAFLVSCSFDNMNTTGYWSGSEKEKNKVVNLEEEQKKIVRVKLYSTENLYSKELSKVKSIVLSDPKQNLSWEMPGMNLQNSLGHIYLSGIENIFLKKK